MIAHSRGWTNSRLRPVEQDPPFLAIELAGLIHGCVVSVSGFRTCAHDEASARPRTTILQPLHPPDHQRRSLFGRVIAPVVPLARQSAHILVKRDLVGSSIEASDPRQQLVVAATTPRERLG